MTPLINSGDKIELKPCKIEHLAVGDIVLCRVNGNTYLHLVKAISDGRVQIGNNHGKINGWTRTIYGKKI